MNFDDRREFEALAAEQQRLRIVLARVDAGIEALRARVEKAGAQGAAKQETHPIVPPPLPKAAVPSAPVVTRAGEAAGGTPAPQQLRPVVTREQQPPPVHIGPPTADAETKRSESTVEKAAAPETSLPSSAGVPPPPVPPAPRESWEMRLGTVWLARIGIVILITGLVFLGNYAWHAFVHRLGAAGKLALLTLAGATLGGLGVWLERGRAEVRNYSRVLMAGGAATLYYAAYAAHFVAPLKVIQSPLAGGSLLLALAGVFVWWADRRQSQTIAVMTVLLAYYTSAINAIGAFTLFSSLLLTGAATFFLIRNRWAAVSWAALLGTYGSFGFWRWHQASDPASYGLRLAEPWGMSVAFLLGYWLLFTAAVLLAPGETLPPRRRTPFLSLNNGAFFGFAALQIAGGEPGAFWWLCLSFGVALLALAEVARRRRPDDLSLDGAYLVQGLVLVTVGLIAKITGPALALTLAAESALLLGGVRLRHGRIFQIMATLAAWCAFLQCYRPFALASPGGAASWRLIEIAVAAILIFDCWWLKERRNTLAARRFEFAGAAFVLPGLWLVGDLLRIEVPDAWAPAAFAGVAIACTASIYLLSLPEVTFLGQLFLGVSIATWAALDYGPGPIQPWWSPLPVAVSALGLAHWWQRQRTIGLSAVNRVALETVFAAALIGLGVFWMSLFVHGDAWLLATTAVALATLIYGVITRCWPIALLGQVFAVLGCAALLRAFGGERPFWAVALVPIAGLGATSLVITYLARKRQVSPISDERQFELIAAGYRIAGSILLGFLGHEYVEEPWRVAFYGVLGAGMILAGSRARSPQRAWTGLAYAGVAFITFWIRWGWPFSWPDLAAFVAIPASLRFGRRLSHEAILISDQVRVAFTAVAVASIWLWVTRWTLSNFNASLLTPAWALLAPVIFAAGLSLRERVYRIGGFIILGAAIGRVFLVDVWRLETIYRIVSFLVLGVVMLALGFVYNRFAETIRRWL